ncbi:hypothetical protein AX16_005294 [Volvariella volvacea WC 439]|nr:hypothetical protein AX16_005294 [Volvariella volvacea WC 439]
MNTFNAASDEPKPQEYAHSRNNTYPPQGVGITSSDTKVAEESWRLYKEVEKHDNEMCQAWNEEIQNLLIFSSLFAATVTAFTIESYQWLESDPTETTAKMTMQISLQLANLSNPLGYTGNSALSSLLFNPEPRKPYAVIVNILWFLSLSISLSTVLVGILCLQWIREYQRDAHHLTAMEALLLRQHRYVGLTGWKVPQIISVLPVLLQLSVLLFFVGLYHFLWELDHIVAAAIMPVMCIVTLVLFGTALAPIVQRTFNDGSVLPRVQCPYISPQAWLCYLMVDRPRKGFTKWWMMLANWLARALQLLPNDTLPAALRDMIDLTSHPDAQTSDQVCFQSWIHWDEQWRASVGQATQIQYFLSWICKTWGHRRDVLDAVPSMLAELESHELHIGMIDLLYRPNNLWFTLEFGAKLLSQVCKRIAHNPKDLASLPDKQHEKLVGILFHGYSLAMGNNPWSDIPLKSLSKFLYSSLSRIHQNPDEGRMCMLSRLTEYLIARTEDFGFLHDLQPSQGACEDDGRELNISEIETCLMLLGLSRFISRDSICVQTLNDRFRQHIRTLHQKVLPVLKIRKEVWKRRVNEVTNESDNGWLLLVALTAGIQFMLTSLREVETYRRNHPRWKEFYEMVVEIPYGPWKTSMPQHPGHSADNVAT